MLPKKRSLKETQLEEESEENSVSADGKNFREAAQGPVKKIAKYLDESNDIEYVIQNEKLLLMAIRSQFPEVSEEVIMDWNDYFDHTIFASPISTPNTEVESENARQIRSEAAENEKDTKLRIHLKNEESFKSLLFGQVPVGFKLGAAYGQGDCFFDALAQGLNQINNTDVNAIKYLRMECHDFYAKNKDLVDRWNSQEYGGIDDGKDEYGLVQYTVEECNKHFYNRSPIWGRSQIEGIILCRQLDLEGICIIEILEDPETKQPIISFNLVDKEQYKSIDNELAQKLLKDATIPVLVVEQHSLHFVPLLKPSPFFDTLQAQANEHSPESVSARMLSVDNNLQNVQTIPENWRWILSLIDEVHLPKLGLPVRWDETSEKHQRIIFDPESMFTIELVSRPSGVIIENKKNINILQLVL